ncbi:MAG: outer membrane protein assembly factor BamE [Acidobacteria bacterium]|jgi:hypothetical protein|nr:outer membrane protein assembly factor BamE [Acidobacteriota bacterium]
MSKKSLFCWRAILVVLSLLFSAPLLSQTIDQRLKELEKKTAQLELRIQQLEGIIVELQKTQVKPVSSLPDRWKEKASWRLLKKGMSKTEVERVLGTPPKVVPNTHYGDIWYYPDSRGGNASFDIEGRLTSWDEV